MLSDLRHSGVPKAAERVCVCEYKVSPHCLYVCLSLSLCLCQIQLRVSRGATALPQSLTLLVYM